MVCCSCKIELTDENHYKSVNHKCKDCCKAYNKQYQESNKELLKEKSKVWRKNNKDIVNLNTKRYRERNPEKVKEVNKASKYKNREKVRKTEREYYLKNKEKIDLRRSTEKYKNRKKEYVQKNLNKYKAWCAKRRATKLQQTPKWADLKAIEEFYKNCPTGHHVDHIIPLQGKNVRGLHILENLQYLPMIENLKKGNRI